MARRQPPNAVAGLGPLIVMLDESKAAAHQGAEQPAQSAIEEFVELVKAFGFAFDRTRGSHHIFLRPGVSDIINIQERSGQAKGYQVRQFLRIVERLNLTLEEDK
ncbi:MAG TPA: type II toxin-antitoxin system HicA family toxin [Thermomicrobiales bacterium]